MHLLAWLLQWWRPEEDHPAEIWAWVDLVGVGDFSCHDVTQEPAIEGRKEAADESQ